MPRRHCSRSDDSPPFKAMSFIGSSLAGVADEGIE
jgi:hypothetical protein